MDYRLINTDRQFKDATGHSLSSFTCLLHDYERTYVELHGQSYETYLEECVEGTSKLSTLGDALFFVLFQLKNDLIWGSLGVAFGMAGSTAHRNFTYFSELLSATLEKKGHAQT